MLVASGSLRRAETEGIPVTLERIVKGVSFLYMSTQVVSEISPNTSEQRGIPAKI